MKEFLDPRKERDSKGRPKIVTRTVFYTDQVIFEEGSMGHRAYYIESGRVEVSVREGPHKIVVSELGSGEIFGEMALISDEPRSATVTALENTTVAVITEAELKQRIVGMHDEAITSLIDVLIDRLKSANKGQAKYYKNLADYQGRIMGIVNRIDDGFDDERLEDFKDEIEPLLDARERVLDKYS